METANYNLSKTEKQNTTDDKPETLAEYAKKHPHKNTCKNCDKPILETLTFCGKDCTEKYREKQANES